MDGLEDGWHICYNRFVVWMGHGNQQNYNASEKLLRLAPQTYLSKSQLYCHPSIKFIYKMSIQFRNQYYFLRRDERQQLICMSCSSSSIKQQYNNQTLINFMSITRKCLDRKHFLSKFDQVKLHLSTDMRSSLGQTVKKDKSVSRKSKSRDKTIKIAPQRTSSLRQPPSCKNKGAAHRLDNSKESKESRDSLLKSTHSYYIAQRKRQEGTGEKHMKSYKSKEITNASHIINSTFEMQCLGSTHKKKKSNFSTVIGSKFDLVNLNKSAINQGESQEGVDLGQLLLKSQSVLQQYRSRYEALEKENKRYKRKYQEAMRKIKNLENKH